MKINNNIKEIQAELAQARARIERDMRRAERQVAVKARELAELGTNLGVYFTPQGQYQRTQALREGIGAQPLASGTAGLFGVTVFNNADHASYVEYGTYGNDLNEISAEHLSEPLGSSFTPLYLGRSAHNWVAPNPAITRAAVYAVFALNDAFEASLIRNLGGNR